MHPCCCLIISIQPELTQIEPKKVSDDYIFEFFSHFKKVNKDLCLLQSNSNANDSINDMNDDSTHGDVNDDEMEEDDQEDETEAVKEKTNIPAGLVRWREGIQKVTTAPQLAMAFYVLETSIAWHKSIMKAFCQLCHCGDNEDSLLLCDSC